MTETETGAAAAPEPASASQKRRFAEEDRVLPPAPPAATPGKAATDGGLEQLARALHDAYWLTIAGDEFTWEGEEPEVREGWLTVAQTASDGASIAAKAATEALARERDEGREACDRLRREALKRYGMVPGWVKHALGASDGQ